jgi:microcystin degradation protein MlrC
LPRRASRRSYHRSADGGWDAVYLSLHGAAITTMRQTPDLDLVRLVRGLLPDMPLGANFDLHGNMAPEFAALLERGVGLARIRTSTWRTLPARVLDALMRCADGTLQTRRAAQRRRALLPSFSMRTSAGPMRELRRERRAAPDGRGARDRGVRRLSYADTVHTGASWFVVSDARLDLREGLRPSRAQRVDGVHSPSPAPAFHVQLPTARRAIAQALASTRPGLIAITDPTDNPLLGRRRRYTRPVARIARSGVAVPTLVASFADPAVVAAARQAEAGNRHVD